MENITGNFEIRKATELDIDQVHEIEVSSFTVPWTKEDFSSYLGKNGFRVAVLNEKVVGFIIFVVIETESEIQNIAVLPEFRRQGIADKLLLEAFSLEKTKSVEEYFLEVRRSNESAYRLYEKHGFEPIAVRKNYYDKPKEDAIIMRKTIGNLSK